MPELKAYNPKLHRALVDRPEAVLDLKEMILQSTSKGDVAATAESIQAASEDM